MNSIRIFLVVVLLATITLIVFVSALHGYRASMQQAQQLFDLKLADAAHLLDDAGHDYPGGVEPSTHQFGFQVWENGVLQQRSANVPETPLSPFRTGYEYSNFDRYRWRTYAWKVPGRERWIMTTEREDRRLALGEGIILKSVLPVVVSLPVTGLLTWLIVGYGLSPLRQLARRLHNKRASDLGALPLERQPRELRRLIHSINDLLRRLEASFEREKRFASDAAHELRTPISVLKVHLHNLAQDLPPDHHDLQMLTQATERMGKVVEQVLALNRITPGQYQARFHRFDLHELVQQCIADHYSLFDTRNQVVALEGGPAVLDGDSFALLTLTHNLLENASKYTPEGGDIQVRVECDDSAVQLVVEDSGPGIPEQQQQRIFDRFYRLGGDQHDSGVLGCGLGLSIVRQIAALHQASVTLARSGFPTGLRVTVRFPQQRQA